MSCETWSELVALGEGLLMEGSERARALRHFEHCPSCADRAYLLDPTWALGGSERSRRFDRLGNPGFTESEISSLKRDVLEAGRIREVEISVQPRRQWLHAAIAAVLLVVVAAGAALLRTADSFAVAGESGTALASAEAAATARRAEQLPVSGDRVDQSLPTLGSVAPAAARIYDFGQEDFALVMVVHETLDL